MVFGDAAAADIGQVRYQHGSNCMEIFTNGVLAMSIVCNQRVGLGTAAPCEILHILCTTAGDITTVKIDNSNNSNTGSGAELFVSTGGASGGDSTVRFNNTPTPIVIAGLDPAIHGPPGQARG